MNAIQALSQLSYNPMGEVNNTLSPDFVKLFLQKPSLRGKRQGRHPGRQLNRRKNLFLRITQKARIFRCRPLLNLVELDRIELTTS